MKDTSPVLEVCVVMFTVQDSRLQVLLSQQPQSSWHLPVLAVELHPSLESAALACLTNCTGLTEAYLEQLYSYSDCSGQAGRRRVMVAYFALLPSDQPSTGGACRQEAAWHPVDAPPPLGDNHGEILKYALRRLRYKLEYTAVGFELLPETFSLSELQRTYEIILGEKLDKRNFRRRILEAGVIEPTNVQRMGEGRPARLFRYRADAVAEVKARRLFP